MAVPTEMEYQCRLCLATTNSVLNIYEGDFIKKLEVLTTIKVQENDGLPRYSCFKCAQDLEMALSVKERIIESHKTLLDILENDKQLLQNLALDIGSHEAVIIVNCDEISNEEVFQMIPTNLSDISKIPTHKIEYDELQIKEENEENIEYESPNVELKVKSKYKKRNSTSRKPLRRKKCHICERFIRLSNFDRHVTGHNTDLKSKCPICKRQIITTNIEKHIISHESDRTTCQICGAVYKNKLSLRGHINYQHKNSAGQHVCEECGQSFRIKYKLLLHKKKAHTNLRNIRCEKCKKGFFTSWDLKAHMRTHEKLRPYVCDFCQSRFSSSYALKTHRRQHTDEKPFVCEFCDEGFRQKVSLRNHLKSKHGVEEAKEFFCETCGKGFATDYALNVHKRLHLSEKCSVCYETFDADYLETHLREEHSIVKQGDDDRDD